MTELEARGHTELKDLVLEQPQSLSLGTNSGAAGPVTNLRGLGPMRTLTLLNGRRLANEPLQDQYVSVNVIPRMALDRVETLSGGAASIYGADAIGGVQNYWTKRGYEGVSIKAEYATPEMSGGGRPRASAPSSATATWARTAWNAYIAVDHQKKTALFQKRPPGAARPGHPAHAGPGHHPGCAQPNPIANFGFTRAANSNYNPAFATGCGSPYAHAYVLGNASANTPPVYAPGCFRNPLYWTAVTDGSEITTVSRRASWNLPAATRSTWTSCTATSPCRNSAACRCRAPRSRSPPTRCRPTSRFYPGKGITPACRWWAAIPAPTRPAMFIDPTKTPGAVSTLNMNNRPIYFQWGPANWDRPTATTSRPTTASCCRPKAK
jgi:iron complex outermembrane receptor protein